MAGSFEHCLGEDGKFEFELIEHLGDAHEACEHMFYMIDFLASFISQKTGEAKTVVIEIASNESYDTIYPNRKQDK